MTDYAIGDIQGCAAEFEALLKEVSFKPGRDTVYLLGDLVNRGPDSLAVLRRVRSLGTSAVSLLGNHDLHLLANAAGGRSSARDTFSEILAAPDRDDLLEWLAALPLAVRWPVDGSLLVHAGIAPQWSPQMTLELAAEVSDLLRGTERNRFLSQMYGDEPRRWDDSLAGFDRARFVVNVLTRLRKTDRNGNAMLDDKSRPDTGRQDSMPWFQVPGRLTLGTRVVFGHWSTLGRIEWPDENVYCLDTGCVWGGKLTAMNLETGEITQVMSSMPPHP